MGDALLLTKSSLVLHILLFLRMWTSIRTECTSSIQGVVLRNHVYRSFKSNDIQKCYYACRDDELCQSINYYHDKKICELNNRTAAVTSLGNTPASGHVFYFDNPFRVQLGSSKKVPALSCQEIKKSSSEASSGRYWLDPSVSGSPISVYCNMTTAAVVNCTRNPCQNGGTCNYQGRGHYTCTCSGSYTGAHCEAIVRECHVYTSLTEANRHEKYKTILPKQCDNALHVGWYRFSGLAGTKMPTKCVPTHHCNTDAPGWLKGHHPSVQEGAVSRTVCFNWFGRCCMWSVNVQVRDCGAFYVYKLVGNIGCSFRFCGSN